MRRHNEALTVAANAASTIQIVRPLESIAEMQPQLQPGFAEIVSDYFPVFQFCLAALLIIKGGLRRRLAHFKMGAHCLDLRVLLFEIRDDSPHLFL
jgi:hypothetical protein